MVHTSKINEQIKKSNGGNESASHRIAKESVYKLTKSGIVSFEVDGNIITLGNPSFIEIEKAWWIPPVAHGLRSRTYFSADIMVVTEDRKVAIEIVCSNPPSEYKLAFYRDQGIECWVVRPANIAVQKIKATREYYVGNEIYDFSKVSWDRPSDLTIPTNPRPLKLKKLNGRKVDRLTPYPPTKDGMLEFLRAVKQRYNSGAYCNLQCLQKLKTEKGFSNDTVEVWEKLITDANISDSLSKSGWRFFDGFLIKI